MQNTLDGLYTVTRARPGSRTLIDPLSAFCLAFESNPSDLAGAYKAAQKAQESTATMESKAGRSACESCIIVTKSSLIS